MKIEVVLYATLTRYHPEEKGNKPFSVELPEGATVMELIEKVGIQEGEAKQVLSGTKAADPTTFLKMVNGWLYFLP